MELGISESSDPELGRMNNLGKNGGDFLLPQALLEIILGVVLGVAAH